MFAITAFFELTLQRRYVHKVNYIQNQTDGFTIFNHTVSLSLITIVNDSFVASH